MAEDQKIKEIISQYSSYFTHSNADVGHTQKGIWFFYEYDEKHDYYNSFIRFETAKELELLIAQLAADDINVLIEAGTEDIQHALKEIDINDATECCYDGCIPELLKNMETLNNASKKWAERMDAICRSFSGIMERLQDKN